MKKRIFGGVLLGLGLLWSGISLVTMAYAIPSSFTLEGEGLVWIARLVKRFHLTDDILMILTGFSLLATSVPLLLSPQRRKIRLAGMNDREWTSAQVSAFSGEPGEYVIHTRLMGMESEERVAGELARLKPGDTLVCRSVASQQIPELLCVYTRRGEKLGYLDTALVRGLRNRYPHHCMVLSVSKISGGGVVPYICEVRIGILRQ